MTKEPLCDQRECPPELVQLAADAARRAHPVFVAEGWKWTTHNPEDLQEAAMPTRERIETRLREMLTDLAERGETGHTISSGRFIVSRDVDSTHVIYGVDLAVGSYYEELYP